jgi:hypothetical protein
MTEEQEVGDTNPLFQLAQLPHALLLERKSVDMPLHTRQHVKQMNGKHTTQ